MSTLAEDILAGIVAVLKGPDFAGSIPDDRVGSGMTWDGSDDLGAYGRGVVRYLGQAPLRTYDTSAQIEHTYEVVWQYGEIADLTTFLTAMEDALVANFADGGETLRTALTNTSRQTGGAIVVTLSPGIPIAEPGLSGGAYTVERSWQITVTAWRAL